MELARVVLALHLKRVRVRLRLRARGGLRPSLSLGFDLGFALNHLALLRDRVVVIGAQLVESACLGGRRQRAELLRPHKRVHL
tara:strand:+ start:224 stop:472 length:249 start_codon:yes stop_codon:yes gene_type:complete